ncbi:hypothetical protein NLG97_g9989 [Lecanicillium saksenae]|uniref:Uncharacterized protein n=1 Tax=Lecanicillium saksenae TaxID=468837 RepID=A0ACC1QHP4_9HYPO|nr:hypothetical protein NLG97_g9989 [Lecanicillium saksenae]
MSTPDSSHHGHGHAPSPAPGAPLHGRVGTAPPAGSRLPPPKVEKPPAPKPSKGPATFEDMGIPQGKNEGDCVVM